MVPGNLFFYIFCESLSYCNFRRGDVQPFTELGLRLQADGHRVRLATHECFRSYILEKGLEFYPLAGDPMLLSEFMVKTQGFLIPTSAELIYEVMYSFPRLQNL